MKKADVLENVVTEMESPMDPGLGVFKVAKHVGWEEPHSDTGTRIYVQ